MGQVTVHWYRRFTSPFDLKGEVNRNCLSVPIYHPRPWHSEKYLVGLLTLKNGGHSLPATNTKGG